MCPYGDNIHIHTLMRNSESVTNETQLKNSSEVLRALCHPLRIQILKFIDENDNINVNKIYNTLHLEQSITSQHLSILRKAGLVTTQRNGKFIYYHINYEKIAGVVSSVRKFLEEKENTEVC